MSFEKNEFQGKGKRKKKEGEFQQLVAKNYYHEIKEKMKTSVSDTVLRQR